MGFNPMANDVPTVASVENWKIAGPCFALNGILYAAQVDQVYPVYEWEMGDVKGGTCYFCHDHLAVDAQRRWGGTLQRRFLAPLSE